MQTQILALFLFVARIFFGYNLPARCSHEVSCREPDADEFGSAVLDPDLDLSVILIMAPTLVNRPPNHTQRLAVRAMIARQESLVAQLRGYQEEDERERERLAANGSVLQRSARSVEMFRDIGTGIHEQLSPVLIALDQLLLSQKADHVALSSLLPSTKALLTDWTAVRHAVAALLSTLQAPMKEIEQFVVSVTNERDNTEVLKHRITDATATLSDMIQSGLQSIRSNKASIFHPMRCLPDEIMLQIFWESIKEERDGLRQMLPLTGIPRLPSTLAGVCKRWRNIVLRTPHFWNYICAPSSGLDRPRLDGWEKTALLAKSTSLEMTIPPNSQITVRTSALRFHRLNITNIATVQLPFLPSPHHLWISHPNSNHPPHVIPAALISSTFRLTCINNFPIFDKKNLTIRVISIKGVQSGQFLKSMMRNLLRLQTLDMTQLRLVYSATTSKKALTHPFLSHLAIHASALDTIDNYLRRGLRLPALRRFEVADIKDEGCSAHRYPSIVSQFGLTITTLEISGSTHRNSILSWIEALLSLEELVTNGDEAALVTLDLLYQPSDAETNSQGAIRLPPEGLTSLVIREFMHEGSSIYQQLEGIRGSTLSNSQPIRVIFERCPNILPSIRAEFSGGPEDAPSQSEIPVGPVYSDSQ